MKAGHRLEGWALAGLLRLLARMPEGAARALARGLALLWYAADGRHRSLAAGNIAAAGYPWSRRPRALARANFLHLAENLAEFARLPGWSPDDYRRRVEFTGLENLAPAMESGKGFFCLTAHLGNWEVMAAAYAARWPLSVVARPMSNPAVDDLIRHRREASGLKVIPDRRAVWSIMRALERGEAVGVLLDQNALVREGVFVDFMGRKASTNFGLAMLAMRTGVPVIPCAAYRVAPGRHRVVFHPALPCSLSGDRDRDLRENTARYTAAIESMVSSRPEQWFWIHNRWKHEALAGSRAIGAGEGDGEVRVG